MEAEIKDKNREPNLIVFARQNYTATQKDIFTLAVSQVDTGFNVQNDLFANKTVTVSVQMLNEISNRTYTRIKAECDSMQEKRIKIENDEKEEFEFIVVFPRIKYKKGIIELTMFADVAKSFAELKEGYSEFYVRESLSLEQFNKKRFYEMLSSYKKRFHPVWTVYDDELKDLLGMGKAEYKGRPKEFGQKIIGVCINAINELTSLSVSYERDKNKQGWFTTFTVADKKKEEPKQSEKKELDDKGKRLTQKLKDIGIIRPDIVRIIVDEKQPETWAWFSKNAADIASGKLTSPSGALLYQLGLVEKKKK